MNNVIWSKIFAVHRNQKELETLQSIEIVKLRGVRSRPAGNSDWCWALQRISSKSKFVQANTAENRV